MNHNKETFETWNKVAMLYEEKFMDLNLYNETYDFFSNALTNDSKVLDIGCGPGNITKYLLKNKPMLSVLGIDVAPKMVELAARNNQKATFEVRDCRTIDAMNSKFDGIICGFCLPYLSESESEKFISDCKNLLVENGMFYLSFVEGNQVDSGFKVSSSGDRVYFYYHDLTKIGQMLEENGFTPPKIFNVDFKRSETETEIHTILITNKLTTK